MGTKKMRKQSSLLLAVLAVLVVLVDSTFGALPRYEIIDLGTLGSGYTSANAINEIGQVVGLSHRVNLEGRAFLWDSDNGMILLSDLLSANSGWMELRFAFDINNRGQIVGEGITDAGQYHAFLMTPVLPTIYYVDADAAGNNDGTSWADAYNYLQDALATAWSGDEIRVAEGIYTPDSNLADPNGSGDRRATFQLINGVTLKGGYAGFGQPDPNARDIELYETILSGDLYGNDGGVGSIYELLHDPNRAENTYHVVTGSVTDATAVLDGFIVIAGNAYTWPNYYSGGGIYNEEGSPTVINCTFTKNLAGWGGGIYSAGGSPLVRQCRITGNWAEDGGGVYCRSSGLIIQNCIVSKNKAVIYGGGGIYCCDNSEPNIIDCIIEENWASNWAGGIGCNDSNCLIINCTIRNNLASSYGGGVDFDASKATIINCDIINNQAYYEGGGIYNWISNVTIIKCRITNNFAWCDECHDGGGGLCNRYHSTLEVVSSIFKGNSSLQYYLPVCGGYGGGIYNNAMAKLKGCTFIANSATYGGGIANGDGELMVTNCTFSGNSASDEGGGILNFSNSGPMVMNCIFWGNNHEEIDDVDSMTTVSYSDVQGGWPGEGNIDQDPCFVDSGRWEDPCNTPGDFSDDIWVDGDYHLLQGSPCIDAGDPNYIAEPNETDLDGKPRIIGGRIDMGAYESPVPAEARIVPRTINLTSKGKWITCYIWLPEDYNVADIDPNSVLLEDEIEAEQFLLDEQQQIAIVKFGRSEVQAILNVGQAELTITGQLMDGIVFEGTDAIRVIDKGGGKWAK